MQKIGRNSLNIPSNFPLKNDAAITDRNSIKQSVNRPVDGRKIAVVIVSAG